MTGLTAWKRLTIAELHKATFADITQLMAAADKACQEMEQDWEKGITRWVFDDGSVLIINGTAVETR